MSAEPLFCIHFTFVLSSWRLFAFDNSPLRYICTVRLLIRLDDGQTERRSLLVNDLSSLINWFIKTESFPETLFFFAFVAQSEKFIYER